MVGDLNIREMKFVNAYIRTGIATKAAIEAGYSEKSARQTSCKKLNDPRIKAAVAEAKGKAADILGVDAAWVLRQALDIIETCSMKVSVNDVTGGQKTDPDGNPVYKMVDASTALATLKIISEWVGINREKREEDSTTGVLQVQIVPSEEEWING